MSASAGQQPGSGDPGLGLRAPRVDASAPGGARLVTPVLLRTSQDAGAGRPAPAGSGWEALTPRELEVVALVTLGVTNQQAARRLRLSPHTVNAHLRHVFSKLGVSSRVELTRVAVARELHAAPPPADGTAPRDRW